MYFLMFLFKIFLLFIYLLYGCTRGLWKFLG